MPCEGYLMVNIYNCDKTSIFFWVAHSKTCLQQDEVLARNKVLKECSIILLPCRDMGKKEKLWLVGKDKHPTNF